MAKSGLDIVALLQTLSVPEYYLGMVIYLNISLDCVQR
jgi:hypothetical protein